MAILFRLQMPYKLTLDHYGNLKMILILVKKKKKKNLGSRTLKYILKNKKKHYLSGNTVNVQYFIHSSS